MSLEDKIPKSCQKVEFAGKIYCGTAEPCPYKGTVFGEKTSKIYYDCMESCPLPECTYRKNEK